MRRTPGHTLLILFALVIPGRPGQAQAWRQVGDPAAAGWDSTRLEAARRFADSAGSTAVLAVHRGVVVTAWGEVTRPIALASVRKSLMATLIGAELRHGGLSLDATLGGLGISDIEPLDSVERGARVRDLLAARSGVYRPAAQEPQSWAERRPARGAHRPGQAWFYNNWGFNVTGTIYERWRGRSVYQGFGEAVARPLGMEDYRVGDGIRFREPSRSKHPAHAFRLSARDLARVGELYLRGGRRGGRELLPPGWVDSVSARHTEWENGSGYGWLWWVNPTRGPYYRSRPTLDGLDAVAAIGAGGELLLVLPREELVIVHLVDREHERDLPEDAALAVADLIASARPGSVMPVSRAAAGPLSARPFTGRPPLPARPRLAPPTAEDLRALPGVYHAGPDVEIRVTAYDGGLFALHSRLGEIELLREGADAFLAVGGRIRVRFERDGAGKVKGMVAETPGGPLAATRR